MNDLEQKNLLQTENQTSDELNAEELEAVSGGVRSVLPDILGGVAGAMFGSVFGSGSGGGSNRNKSASKSNSNVADSGNSHVTVNCGLQPS